MAARSSALVLLMAAALASVPSASGQGPQLDAHGDPLPEGALLRLGRVERWRQGGTIDAIALSPDGKRLASAGSLGAIVLWEVPSGKELHVLTGHDGPIRALAFSPDGKLLASAGGDQTIRFWDMDKGKALHRCMGSAAGSPHAIAFSPDGQRLAGVGSYHVRSLRIWNVSTGQETAQSFWFHDTLNAVLFSPSGKQVLAQRQRGGLDCWDAITGKEVLVGGMREESFTPLAFTPDGKELLAFASGRGICALDPETLKEKRQLAEAPKETHGFAVAPGGKWLVLVGDGKARVLEVATGKQVREARIARETTRVMALDHEGRFLVSVMGQGRLRAHDLGAPPVAGKEAASAAVLAVAVAGNGQTLATVEDERVRLWDRRAGKVRGVFETAHGGCRCAAFAPADDVLAIGAEVARGPGGGWIFLVDPASGKEKRAWRGHDFGTVAVAFSQDGGSLLSVGSDHRLRVWDVASGKKLRNVDLGIDPRTAAFSPDRNLVACAAVSGPVELLDTHSGQRVCHFPVQRSALALAVAPDGRTVASVLAGEGFALWEVATGLARFTLHYDRAFVRHELSGPRAALTFESGGRWLALGCEDLSARLLDVAGMKEVRQLNGHRDMIAGLAFGPRGRELLSGSRDTTALIWDTARLSGQAPKPGRLNPKELEATWDILADEDPRKAHAAIWSLIGEQQGAVAWLQQRVRPVVPLGTSVEEFVEDLDSGRFQVRQKAMAELARLGLLAKPALTRALGMQPSLEKRQRVEQLLRKLDGVRVPSEDLRGIRAVEVLEAVRTPEARKLLAALAAGEPQALVTIEARASLARLTKR